jgi:hypothetical protein
VRGLTELFVLLSVLVHPQSGRSIFMKAFSTIVATIAISLVSYQPADAKGCLKGAVLGGAAGHYAGHHGLLGAAAGCAIGRHEANKRDRTRLRDYPTTTGQSVQYR